MARDVKPDQDPAPATMPWWVAAAGGGVVSAIAGWALVAALVVVAQFGVNGSAGGDGFVFATGVWLLAHGGALVIGGTPVTLVPLGLTLLIGLMIHGASAYAGRQALLGAGEGHRPGAAVATVVGVFAGAYTVVVVVAGVAVGGGTVDPRSVAGAAVLTVVVGFFGARKACKWDFHLAWPAWARAVPRAIGAGVLVAALGGVVALIAALIAHRAQFITLTEALAPGWAGGVVISVAQFFYVVNLVIWATAWTFGPGFTVGDGSVVSLVGSQVGLLPALPVTAALPSGVASAGDMAWLAVPVAAGAAAAIVILRARPWARFDETALVGGLAGLVSGCAVTALAMVTRGSLGVERLVGLGPFVTPLAIIAPSIMGLGGMATGLVAGLVRRPRHAAQGEAAVSSDDKPARAKRVRGKSAEETEVTVALADTAPDKPGRRKAKEEQPPINFFPDEPGTPDK